MLNPGKKEVRTISDKLQFIYGMITRAYEPLPEGGASVNERVIKMAKVEYTNLRNSNIAGLKHYIFLEFDKFKEKVHAMDSSDFYEYISKSPSEYQEPPKNKPAPVPINTFANNNSKVGNVLDVDRLSQADVMDILSGSYNKQAASPMGSHMAAVVSTASIVSDIEQNVVALSNGKGMPFGTGLAIHPHMILTARHCLEKKAITDIMVRNNFQKQNNGEVDFWTHNTVAGLVEENAENDYVIVWVAEPIKNFKPLKLNLNGQHEGSSIFMHHPKGWIKKVSVNVSVESNFLMQQHVAMHDSVKGSSGGGYFNAAGEVFALHCFKDNQGLIGAKFLFDIYQSSDVLKLCFEHDGTAIFSGNFSPKLQGDIMLEPSEWSKAYHRWLETIERKPTGAHIDANQSRSYKPELAHHHIIPKSNLEFLWMLSKLLSGNAIENKLKLLAWPPGEADGDELVVNNVIWAPWNLFTGPVARPKTAKGKQSAEPGYDPGGDYIEPSKPLSFPANLWGAICELNVAIEKAWSDAIGKVKPTAVQNVKRGVIGELDACDGSSKLASVPEVVNPGAIQQSVLDVIITKLELIRGIIGNITQYKIHMTQDRDWTFYDPEYVIELLVAKPEPGSVRPITLYLYKENAGIFYQYLDNNARLKTNQLDISGGLRDIAKPGHVLTESEWYCILEKLKLLGSYKLRISFEDGIPVKGLMLPSVEGTIVEDTKLPVIAEVAGHIGLSIIPSLNSQPGALEVMNTSTILSSNQSSFNNQNINITVNTPAEMQLNLDTEPWVSYYRNARYNGLADYVTK